ncbi:class I SAM-dependent methyltransferase [Sulfitobacter sp. 1151]|uniref:Class I SAM-dependent methyltransferase n=2 Tax=Parasulfitobacter algicola TaxID=2614809 RepID=A0ABX2IVF9_9RHOB|nr:class I SAM-dependent methyltransferase [Sulfitobacter algicola]
MSALEEEHWWFAARRDLIQAILNQTIPDQGAPRILEAGCGTGGNLKLLESFGSVDAFEFDAAARDIAITKSDLPIAPGSLPNDIPFSERSYDIICLFDVLEHIEDDQATLTALASRLASGGRIIITVPAFPALWSRHDERHHHFRRYTRRSLEAVAKSAALRIDQDGYYNTILLPLAVATRAFNGLLKRDVADEAMPGPLVNKSLYKIFSTERHLIGRLRMPFGLSFFAILQLK